MKKLFFCTVFISIFFIANAQLIVNNSLTVQQLVQNVLLGPGITASNITYVGDPTAIGYFNGLNTNLGIDSGLIMATGAIQNAIGPNNTSSATTGFVTAGDTDISIISTVLTYDAAIVEFDFVPISDTVTFRYVFGSEEYMEFVSTSGGGVNDGFGFFLSGPGINGTFSNNAINLAVIPNTTTYVTINDVNLNSNSTYYFDNGSGFGNGTAPDGLTIQYDGFTVVMIAKQKVTCGEMYHIKLAIADGGDSGWDSGVFLEAGSFSGGTGLDISTSILLNDTVCPNDTVLINCTGSIAGNPTITWDFNGGNVISGSGLGPYLVNWSNPGQKTVKVSVTSGGIDPCSEAADQVFLVVAECPVSAPNVFTPNGDNINEKFKFNYLEKYPKSRLEVFNRWGNRVYDNVDYKNDWNAANLADGTYYYILEISNGKSLSGYVTIIR